MLDLTFIRENADAIRKALVDLNTDGPLDEILALDVKRREMLADVEALRAERNRVSKEIPKIKDKEEKGKLIASMREVGAKIKELEAELGPAQEKLDAAMLRMPNMPDPSVPVGPDDSENVITRQCGELPTFDFEPKPHWAIGEDLDIIDFERGVKISGTRFYILKGAAAKLQRALVAFMIDLHVEKHGYTEVYPPFMVREQPLVGTGQLPKFADNLYKDHEEELYWVPTAEVPVTNMYADEILDGDQLPIYHTAYTACFRREKMSAGKDTRGIKRGHQFDKVEMVKFVKPETSMDELESLIDNAEDVCRALDIPYRIVQMCTGDLSFTAAIKYDVELWAAGCAEWLEVSSCSNFKDFQARRANIRFRPEKGARPQFVHTLNGSGLALPRLVIAILENCQREDGSVAIPEALQPYMGGMTEIR